MSRIGQTPIEIPKGVEVVASGSTIKAKGPKGELSYTAPAFISWQVKDGKVVASRTSEDVFARSMHGTSRSHAANIVSGVSKGYSKELEITGVGYRVQQQGDKLVFNLGLSHQIDFKVPAGIKVAIKDGVALEISGADKHMVGQVSARIRGFAPAEPYKGKGVKYKNEQIRRKAGKTVA